jgi:hypothetical protein
MAAVNDCKGRDKEFIFFFSFFFLLRNFASRMCSAVALNRTGPGSVPLYLFSGSSVILLVRFDSYFFIISLEKLQILLGKGIWEFYRFWF